MHRSVRQIIIGILIVLAISLVGTARPALAEVCDVDADGKVDAGDISALVLEIFDGDGNLPVDAPGGSFGGDQVGSDANEDGIVDAGDISCAVLLIFNGLEACE